MQLSRVCTLLVCCLMALGYVISAPSPQEPLFELPVQLLGFPVIIAAVRITNFFKKFAYALNPKTYMSRSKRFAIAHDEEILDVAQVEKKLINEFGYGVCIYERTCMKYAAITMRRGSPEKNLDWDEIFSNYKASPDPMKDNYLLSVFLGDIVGSPRLCRQLTKRGRACDERTLSD